MIHPYELKFLKEYEASVDPAPWGGGTSNRTENLRFVYLMRDWFPKLIEEVERLNARPTVPGTGQVDLEAELQAARAEASKWEDKYRQEYERVLMMRDRGE